MLTILFTEILTLKKISNMLLLFTICLQLLVTRMQQVVNVQTTLYF